MESFLARTAVLRVVACALLLTLLSTGSANAASFNFYYHLESGSVLSGILEGTIQSDGDTVEVGSVTMPALDDWPGPELVYVQSFLGLNSGTPGPALVSFSGTMMDIIASTEINGVEGFLFATPPGEDPLFSSSASYGDAFEFFDREFWYLVDRNVLPEPTSTIALVVFCLAGILSVRRHSPIRRRGCAAPCLVRGFERREKRPASLGHIGTEIRRSTGTQSCLASTYASLTRCHRGGPAGAQCEPPVR